VNPSELRRWVGPALVVTGLLFALSLAGLPVLAYAPLLFLLACPLMMFWMMRGMHRADPSSGRETGQGDQATESEVDQ